MSVILEALRKSEAERQRGRAPGLFVEQVPARARKRRWPGAWPGVFAALLLLVLAAWAWREWGRATAPMPAPAATATAEVAPSTPAPEAAPAPYVSEAIGAAPAAARETAPAPAAAPATDFVAAPEPPVDTPAPASVADVAPVPSADVVPSPPVADPVESLPSVGSLAATERSQLPPLKLSMHVYADEPAQRFVILDGQRLGEGASPAPGVVLEHIRRDGLVLSVNGQRLLLARP